MFIDCPSLFDVSSFRSEMYNLISLLEELIEFPESNGSIDIPLLRSDKPVTRNLKLETFTLSVSPSYVSDCRTASW